MNETILQILRDFAIDDYRPIVPRSLDLGEPLPPRRGNLVKVITGMRRSGKSYRLLQEMVALNEGGVPWERMCYFTFEDDRLGKVTSQTGDELVAAFLSKHPESFDEGCYFFLDEIQEMEGWGAWMRRMVDTHKATFYVTGSSSRLLSDEIGTEFRGRAIEFELLPLSFSEYLGFAGAGDIPLETTTGRARLERLLDSYLTQGGFPDAVGLTMPHRISLLQGYVSRVTAKDVVERNGIESYEAASLVGQRLLELNGCTLSVRKLENDLRSMGRPASRATLSALVDHFVSAYLVFLLEERRAQSAPTARGKKVYAIDPGLALANGRAGTNNEGHRLEDAVYLELRRRHIGMRRDGIGSYRTGAHGYEVDFLVGDSALEGMPTLYQVCHSLEDAKTRKRELRALCEAAQETGIEDLVVIVRAGKREEIVCDGASITVVPLLDWLLQG